MKKLIYILGFILLTFYGCKKEPKVTSEVLYFDKTYNNFKFKEHSYWIYQNDLNNEIDSLNLVSVDSGFYWNPPPVNGTAGTQREFYKMSIVSVSDNYTYFDFIDSYGIRRNPSSEWYICGRIIYSIINQSNFEHIDSLSINGKVFYNITKCKILANDYVNGCSNSGFDFNTDLFIAPDWGIIRKVVYLNQYTITWDIIRWKIIK